MHALARRHRDARGRLRRVDVTTANRLGSAGLAVPARGCVRAIRSWSESTSTRDPWYRPTNATKADRGEAFDGDRSTNHGAARAHHGAARERGREGAVPRRGDRGGAEADGVAALRVALRGTRRDGAVVTFPFVRGGFRHEVIERVGDVCLVERSNLRTGSV